MTPSLRLATLAALVVLHPAAAAFASDPLPPACDMLQALPTSVLPTGVKSFKMIQDQQNDLMRTTVCLADNADGLSAATLLLRHFPSAKPPPSTAQRDAVVKKLGETFGHSATVEALDFGEAALWVEDTRQVMAWYRDGRVLLVVTAAGPDGKPIARRIAEAIVVQFP